MRASSLLLFLLPMAVARIHPKPTKKVGGGNHFDYEMEDYDDEGRKSVTHFKGDVICPKFLTISPDMLEKDIEKIQCSDSRVEIYLLDQSLTSDFIGVDGGRLFIYPEFACTAKDAHLPSRFIIKTSFKRGNVIILETDIDKSHPLSCLKDVSIRYHKGRESNPVVIGALRRRIKYGNGSEEMEYFERKRNVKRATIIDYFDTFNLASVQLNYQNGRVSQPSIGVDVFTRCVNCYGTASLDLVFELEVRGQLFSCSSLFSCTGPSVYLQHLLLRVDGEIILRASFQTSALYQRTGAYEKELFTQRLSSIVLNLAIPIVIIPEFKLIGMVEYELQGRFESVINASFDATASLGYTYNKDLGSNVIRSLTTSYKYGFDYRASATASVTGSLIPSMVFTIQGILPVNIKPKPYVQLDGSASTGLTCNGVLYDVIYGMKSTIVAESPPSVWGIDFGSYIGLPRTFGPFTHFGPTSLRKGCITSFPQITTFIDAHGNDFSSAHNLGMIFPQVTSIVGRGLISETGSIDYPGDQDYFTVRAPMNGALVFYSTGTTDTYGYLYDSDFNLIAANDDFSDRNFRVSTNAAANGVYFLQVTHFSSQMTGSYTLNIETGAVEDYGDIITDSFVVSSPASTAMQSISGQLNFLGDTDWFRITAGSSGVLSVSTASGLDTYGCLFTSTYAFIVCDDDTGTDLNFLIQLNVASGSIFYLAILGYSRSVLGSYQLNYQLALPQTSSTVGAIPSPTSTPNALQAQFDSATDLGKLLPNTASLDRSILTTDSLGGNGNRFFRFEVAKSGLVTIFASGPLDTVGTLFDSSGSQLAFNDDAAGSLNFQISHTMAPLERYFIRINEYQGRAGSFNLTISTSTVEDYGDMISQAYQVGIITSQNSRTLSGVLDYVGDIDYFSFSISQNGRLHTSSRGNTDTYACLYFADGTLIACDDDAGPSANFEINVPDSMSGSYFLMTRGYAPAVMGNYEIWFNMSSSATQTSPIIGPSATPISSVDLHSDFIDNATSIGILYPAVTGNFNRAQINVTAGLDFANDHDYLKFVSASDGTVRVFSESFLDTYGLAYSSSGQVIVSDDDSGDMYNFLFDIPVYAGMPIVILIRGYSSIVLGPYALRLQLSATDDFDDSLEFAYDLGNIAGSVTINGLINFPEDRDVFTFSAPKNQQVELSLSPGARLCIFNSSKVFVECTHGQLEQLVYVTGRHFAVVNGSTNSYNLTISPSRPATSSSSAYVTSSTTVAGTLLLPYAQTQEFPTSAALATSTTSSMMPSTQTQEPSTLTTSAALATSTASSMMPSTQTQEPSTLTTSAALATSTTSSLMNTHQKLATFTVSAGLTTSAKNSMITSTQKQELAPQLSSSAFSSSAAITSTDFYSLQSGASATSAASSTALVAGVITGALGTGMLVSFIVYFSYLKRRIPLTASTAATEIPTGVHSDRTNIGQTP